jgi:hypothetical protein
METQSSSSNVADSERASRAGVHVEVGVALLVGHIADDAAA